MPRLRPLSPVVLIVLGGMLLVAATTTAMAQHEPRDAKQQIANLEQQWRTATLTSDVGLMDKLLSDDFVGISWTGQVNNKSSQLDRLRSRTLIISHMDFFDQKIKVLGNVAIVTSRAEVVGINDGTQINDSFRYTRVYQHLPSGGWKITNFEATRMPTGMPNGGLRRSRGMHPPPPVGSPAATTPPAATMPPPPPPPR
jgi:ketosteroid isomerase-like protein